MFKSVIVPHDGSSCQLERCLCQTCVERKLFCPNQLPQRRMSLGGGD
jgi:hypothetical protein